MRFPLYLTPITALGAWWATLGMTEPGRRPERKNGLFKAIPRRLSPDAERRSLDLNTPLALTVIVGGMLFDHLCRLFVTLNSTYFRLIGLPDASFGLIGAGIALLGVAIARPAAALGRRSPRFNFVLLTLLCLLGLAGAALALPFGLGLLPVVLLHVAMLLTSFLVSHYLNAITDSTSTRDGAELQGLTFNLGYGALGLLYAGLLAMLRGEAVSPESEIAIFHASLPGCWAMARWLARCLPLSWRCGCAGDDPTHWIV